jgi:hypothetical protein
MDPHELQWIIRISNTGKIEAGEGSFSHLDGEKRNEILGEAMRLVDNQQGTLVPAWSKDGGNWLAVRP